MLLEFAWPWFALLLPIPALLGVLRRRRRGQATEETSAVRHPRVRILASAFGLHGGRDRGSGRRYVVGLWLLWILLVAAVMRPQLLELHSEARTRGHDLMLAVDASRSMGALDFSVNGREISRMAVIKGVLGQFIQARKGDRIGLVVFGDYAYLLSPFTPDLDAVRFLLDGIEPGIVGDATAMGDAIGLAVRKLRERPQGSRVLVLVTDGESTAGRLPPLLAAQLAAQSGIRIYTIGVGSKGLVPFIEDGQRKMVRMEIDEDSLQRIASLTDGAYFRATDTKALEEIYRRIDELEKTEVETRQVLIPQPMYRIPLGLALVLLLWLGLFPEAKRRYRRGNPRLA